MPSTSREHSASQDCPSGAVRPGPQGRQDFGPYGSGSETTVLGGHAVHSVVFS